MGLRLWAAALIAAATAAGAAQAADSARTNHVALRLAPQTVAAAPGSTLYVGLQEVIAPGWHTYWRNPGDSGEPTAIAWTLPGGWKAGDIVWPAPGRAATGPLVNYVFSGKVILPTPIQVPASAAPGSKVMLKAAVTYLVCKDVCIPEQAALDLAVPVAAGTAKLDPALGQAITDTLAAAPKPAGLQARFSRSGDTVNLSVTGAQLKGADASRAWFYPYNGELLDHAKPQQVAAGSDGLTLALPAGYGFTHGGPPKAMDGVLALGGGRAWEISAVPGAPLPGAAGVSPSRPSASTGDPGEAAAAPATPAATTGGGAGALLLQVGAAFLGGLILNLMPCVFPVLSIKAAALARHAESPERARAEGLGYLAGVVAAFLVLAGVLIAVRAAGQEVGWGFQLQSAGVTAALALLMLLVALNLSGVFEVGTSVQGAGGGLAARGGVLGSVFTGVLAVVVAAPCTAPFMAPAIGWALVQPPAAALAVFLGLALGLAAPLALVSFLPAAFRLLPKPGPWMEGLRHVLAFPMYATAAWLAWVFASQAGVPGLPFLFAAAVALAFAAWAWGVGQRQDKPLAPRIAAVAGLVAAVPLAAQGASFDAAPAPAPGGGSAVASTGGGLDAQPWSPERVAALTAQGKPVFVDFTAAWCITCQVNERGALAGRRVADAFRRTGAVYLKADWTKRDATIARVLAANGREGVPLYLVYGPGRDKPQVLPQLLTEGAVAAAVEAAARPA